jgi:hypothetical protein
MPRFQISTVTLAIVNYLKLQEPETVVAYGELSRIVGVEIKSTTHLLRSARDILVRDHLHVWVPVQPRVGLRRLRNVEIPDRHKRFHLRRAGRTLGRAGRDARTVNTARLSADDQRRFGVQCIQQHLAQEALSRTTQTRLEQVSRADGNAPAPLNISDLAIALMSTPRRRP